MIEGVILDSLTPISFKSTNAIKRYALISVELYTTTHPNQVTREVVTQTESRITAHVDAVLCGTLNYQLRI